MAELTVAYVAGLMAFAFFLARIVSPNALAFICAKHLGFRNSAATWTTGSKVLQQSNWPFILQTDDAYDDNVRRSILWTSRLMPAISILLSVASVLTPMGLYSSTADGKPVKATFVYAPDPTAFGLHGTMRRNGYAETRACGGVSYGNESFRYNVKPCPSSKDGDDTLMHSPDPTRPSSVCCLDVDLPASIKDVYSSGYKNSTVSSFFDIQWRQYALSTRPGYLNGSAYMIGQWRNVESVLFDEAYSVVEGLIVDTINGRIGFRNHTIPIGFDRAVSWEEDLLFIEPETVCVDSNLTLDYTKDVRLSWGPWPVSRVDLTDRGGFSNLDLTMPSVDLTNPQKNPDLRGRASAAAWMHNVLNAMWFNVTGPTLPPTHMKSSMNQSYPYRGALMTGYPDFSLSKNFYHEFWVYQGRPGFHVFARDSTSPDTSNATFEMRLSNYSRINDICRGINESSPATSRNMLISCGLLQSIPQRTDGGDAFNQEDGAKWMKKLYSCASATKATIKTVTLSYNDTGDDDSRLAGLSALAIRDKQYPDEASMPLWAVEDVGNRYLAGEIGLIWGLISPEHEGRANLTTYRQPWLYLPGRMSTWNDQIPFMSDGSNLAGSDFASNMWLAAYCNNLDREARHLASFENCDSKQIYKASSNIAMWTKWQRLTAQAGTASQVANLIFTDFAASAVVGVKPRNRHEQFLVTPRVLVIRYKLPYAVPALVSAAVVCAVVCVSVVFACTGKDEGLAGIRKHVQRLSPGRIYTTVLASPGEGSDLTMQSRDWNRRFGARLIDLSQEYPTAMQKTGEEESDEMASV
ncbi:hypothetical protein L249_7142 [Ophiocordyceps polyrhachis-furcata BCC 54312]|uniref:Uncharacterized protein n=1 Tax=Ophiocordyceps polyrhachis-furcata BCC 54312 TaxID=1330021 RepID=A0A367LAD8_9HYPO|nr:hypothetical protein L249_7142 [Ophiocordyceps polyrhachis-furcata BCC 54312]